MHCFFFISFNLDFRWYLKQFISFSGFSSSFFLFSCFFLTLHNYFLYWSSSAFAKMSDYINFKSVVSFNSDKDLLVSSATCNKPYNAFISTVSTCFNSDSLIIYYCCVFLIFCIWSFFMHSSTTLSNLSLDVLSA